MKREPKEIVKRFEKLKSERGTWETHWQEIADYCLPNRNDITTVIYPGDKRNIQVFDSTAIQSVELLAGALHGMLTNPSVQWFELTTGDPDMDEDDDIRFWLQDSTLKIHHTLNQTNFQEGMHELYTSLVTFGTAPMAILEHKEKIMYFDTKHIKEVYINENHLGEIDEVYREFEFDAKNIVGEFGIKNLPKKVMKAYEDGDRQKFCIIHAVYPERQHESEKTTFGLNHQFHSQYIFKDGEKSVELQHNGYRKMPYVVPRWAKSSGESYGRSPAMNALPDVKMINKMEETVIKGAQKTVDPPLQLPDDGFIWPIVTQPGGLNFYRSGSQDRIQPVFNDARIDFGFQATDRTRQRIREAFFIDQLQLNQGPQMTATEVMQRTEEKMRLLGPMLGRQQNELLRPLIDRVFDIMVRRNLFIQAPGKLQGKMIDVRYSSLIAKAQRQTDAQNIIRTVEMVAPFVQADPAVLDLINGDEAVRSIATMNGLPQRILRTKEEIDAIRQQKAQAAQQQQEQAQQMMQAEAIGKLGNLGG